MNRQERQQRQGENEPEGGIDAVARAVIMAAIEVHRILGPGFLESVYEDALDIELRLRGVPFLRQPALPIAYKGGLVGDLRPDLLVDGRLIVELKAVSQLAPIHLAQALAYLKATALPLALVINFNVTTLLHGVRRVVLSPQSRPIFGAPGAPGG